MKARKCDRCGKFYVNYVPTEDTNNANAIRLMKTEKEAAVHRDWYDLCEECMKGLASFLNVKQEAPEGPVEPPTEGGDTGATPTLPPPENPVEKPTEGEEGG